MKPPKSKDHFAILGVEPAATPEEIRKAYLDRAREIHPDRFDFNTQPVEWRRANDELALLNEAYAALRGGSGWVSDMEVEGGEEQESRRGPAVGRDRESAEDLASADFTSAMGEVTAGEAAFEELPRITQVRLVARQNGLPGDQLKVARPTHWLHGAAMAALLCWFGLLFFRAGRGEWDSTALMAHTVLTTGVGLLLGRCSMSLLRWARSSLKPAVYLTPIYFIRTGFDVVSFHPLWTLNAVSCERTRKMGFPGLCQVVLRFGERVERLSFVLRRSAEAFLARVGSFETSARQLLEGRRLEALRESDDFFHVRRRPRTGRKPVRRGGEELVALVLPLLASWAALAVAVDMNLSSVQERLVRFPDPAAEVAPPPIPRSAERSRPSSGLDRPTAVTGGVTSPVPSGDPLASFLAPVPAEGEGAGRAGESSIPREAGPVLQPEGGQMATFRDSRIFLVTEEAPGGKDLGSGGPEYWASSPLPPPLNGHLTRYHDEKDAMAPFEIKLRDTEKDLFLTMEDWESRRPVLTVFIRRGQTVKLQVPLGAFRLKYAAGRTWYGEKRLFGPGGVYGGSDEKMDFFLKEDKVTGRTLEIALKEGSGPQAGGGRGRRE